MPKLPEQFALAAKGDEGAFSGIVREYESAVYRYALSFCKNEEDAFDISQEAFLKLWKTLPRFKGNCSPKTWIMGIVRSVAIDFLRAKRPRDTLSLYADGELPIEIPDDSDGANPQKAYEQKERAALVRAAVSSLPHELAETLYLREFENLSYEEIARVLVVRVGTVKSRISRARDGVKEFLEKRNFFG